MTTYTEKLRDPRWQKLRLNTLNKANWRCQECFDNEAHLQVHHRRYIKGREPWEYQTDELRVLCEPCHQELHSNEHAAKVAMARLDNYQMQLAAQVLQHLVDTPELMQELAGLLDESLNEGEA